jgi:hypothetical protein
MSKLTRLFAAALAVIGLGLCGCFAVVTGTISSTPAKGNTIGASASDWGILHLTVPQGLTSNVNGQLQGQCASGKISNVSTELDVREFFLAQQYTVVASGYCS